MAPVEAYRAFSISLAIDSLMIMEPGISIATYIVLLAPMGIILALALIGYWTGRRQR